MVEDKRQLDQEEVGQNAKEPSLKSQKGKVDLFPALADRRMSPINSIRQAPVHARPGTQISIFNPVSFDEALDIVECLRGRAATTISLDNMKKTDASRLVDFVAGASAALDGDFHKLTDHVYLFCPSNVKITAANRNLQKPMSTPYGHQSLDFLYPGAADNAQTRALNSWMPM
jgi:cell division inhibitor SepF